MATFGTVREIARGLPGMEEGTSYGTPAFRVRGKFVARLSDDGEALVAKVGFDMQEMLVRTDPSVFYLADRYRGIPLFCSILRASTKRD